MNGDPGTEAPGLPPSVREDLASALGMVRLSGGWLCVEGVPVAPAGPPSEAPPRALPALSAALYSRWFAAWNPPAETRSLPFSNGKFFASLRAAHAAAGCFEPGWVAVAEHSPYGVLAVRGEETLLVAKGEYVNLLQPGRPARGGEPIAIRARRDVAAPQDGWWMTWSAAGPAPEEAMLRLYWNCGPEFVQPLIRRITEAAGNARVRYTLKCPASPSLFGRRDGTVLYFATRDWPALREPLGRIHRLLAPSLLDATPPMTFRLGRGAALVEDPANGRSFGQTVSSAVARGILEVLSLGEADPGFRVVILANRLRTLGISPDQPYAGSVPSEIEWRAW